MTIWIFRNTITVVEVGSQVTIPLAIHKFVIVANNTLGEIMEETLFPVWIWIYLEALVAPPQ